MTLYETPTFTRLVSKYLDEDEYRLLQITLAYSPDAGVLIQGGHGIRKIRWGAKGHGKRGGVRIIYYWAKSKNVILMLYIYAKNRQSDLTPSQIKALGEFVFKEFAD